VAAAASTPFRVVGIGASAGGIEALLQVLAALPPEFPHPVCVVVHVPATGGDLLAQILDRRCPIAVRTASDDEPLLPGTVYVAPSDRHLVVRGHAAALTGAPQENGVRPAADALLRSVAETCGAAGIGVVLSGALADGAKGAGMIADAGGRVLVQDPMDARVTSMPRHAIEQVGIRAEILPAEAIGLALARLADRPLIGAGT
jgi:two-component system, chemotaxis family, protein-glutamate methylesterase/glutaminase